jgi:hypothetical protein
MTVAFEGTSFNPHGNGRTLLDGKKEIPCLKDFFEFLAKFFLILSAQRDESCRVKAGSQEEASLSLYLPVLNAEAWARTAVVEAGCRLVAVDSGSTDQTVAVLESKGWEVKRGGPARGRIENWRACLTHFLESGQAWMRWLFAGDELCVGSHALLAAALRHYPEAKMMIGGFVNRWGDVPPCEWRPTQQMGFLSPQDVLKRAAKEGNWMGPPLTLFLHRDLVSNGTYDFRDFEWAGDFQAAVAAAAAGGCVVMPELMGVFNGHQRQFFKARQDSAQARLETMAVRMAAVRQLAQLGEPASSVEDLYRGIEKDCWTSSFQARITTAQDPDWLKELAMRFPVRMMGDVLWQRLRRSWMITKK